VSLIKPSFSTGYAKNASESANPNLWKGLVGAWMPSFGVTGGTLKVVSGNGNDGTLTNMDAATDWVATSKGLALDFDGVNDSIGFQQKKLPIGSDPRTVTVRFKMTSDANAAIVNWGGNSSVGSRWNLWRTQTIFGGQKIGIECLNVYKLIDWNFDTNWHDLTVTLSSSNLNSCKIYFDGSEGATSASSGTSTTLNTNATDFVVGRLTGTSIQYFPGKISYVSIYNRALSPTEIKQLYLNPSAPFLRKQQTVGISTAAAFNPYWANQATQLAGTLQ